MTIVSEAQQETSNLENPESAISSDLQMSDALWKNQYFETPSEP